MLSLLGSLGLFFAMVPSWWSVARMMQWVDALLTKEVDLGVCEHGCTFTSDIALLAIDCAILELIRVQRYLAASTRISIFRARERGGRHV